ncbi:inositol monophosphatase family protein [Salsuginibacillus kocurii]|uniref:inositol monophosphatase family protein n=1 Tax=Salsuginibacillus kocurii TaxID=427078 RepID=UPI00037E4969|nr:inositol monophosphatase family protein [Salsuginibacillus kocurii]
MKVSEWKEMIAQAKLWAIEAGKEQLKRMDQPMDISSKTSDIDFVTEVDIWTENFLKERILDRYPDHALLTEESGVHSGKADYEWVIDPIDGTVNYARGLPAFCISIGIRYKGETVAGLIHAPKLGETYETIKGEGAWCNNEPIQVSTVYTLSKAVLGTGFPYDKATDSDNNVEHFSTMITQIGGIRRIGAAALDLAMVASGKLDGYWELKLKEWDVEAGILLVAEAGGQAEVFPEPKGLSVRAGNKEIFNILKDQIKR